MDNLIAGGLRAGSKTGGDPTILVFGTPVVLGPSACTEVPESVPGLLSMSSPVTCWMVTNMILEG